MIRFTIPGLRLVSEANAHEHWRARQKRAATQRGQAATLARNALRTYAFAWLAGPLVVTVTRVAPSRLDSDNAAGCAKHVRDGIADALGVDDRDARVTWQVEQRRGAVREYAVEVTIAPRQVCPHCGAARAA